VPLTVLVVWIAYVYAQAMSRGIRSGRPLDRRELSALASQELPVVSAAVGPTVALLLGAFGLIGENAAIWAALSIGLVTLAAQGVRYARSEHLTLRGAVAYG
jgi:hypothetical protein